MKRTRQLTDREWLAQECAKDRAELAAWLKSDKPGAPPPPFRSAPVHHRYNPGPFLPWPPAKTPRRSHA